MPRSEVKGKRQSALAKDVRALKGIIRRPRTPVSVKHMRKAIARRAGR